MNAQEIREMFLLVCDRVIEEKDELCRLDSFIGDGDHGLTVAKGFQAVKKNLLENSYTKAGEITAMTGEVLSDTMGGAIGLIMGGLFQGSKDVLQEKEVFGVKEFEMLFREGLDYIKAVGGAKEGDRTLIDALAPASKAFGSAVQEKAPLEICMEKAAAAARQGAENTKEMTAQKGRAKFLGEKSKGYVDAGATTMFVIIEAMSSYINNK